MICQKISTFRGVKVRTSVQEDDIKHGLNVPVHPTPNAGAAKISKSHQICSIDMTKLSCYAHHYLNELTLTFPILVC